MQGSAAQQLQGLVQGMLRLQDQLTAAQTAAELASTVRVWHAAYAPLCGTAEQSCYDSTSGYDSAPAAAPDASALRSLMQGGTSLPHELTAVQAAVGSASMVQV